MQLPFSRETFFNAFAKYHAATWPVLLRFARSSDHPAASGRAAARLFFCFLRIILVVDERCVSLVVLQCNQRRCQALLR